MTPGKKGSEHLKKRLKQHMWRARSFFVATSPIFHGTSSGSRKVLGTKSGDVHIEYLMMGWVGSAFKRVLGVLFSRGAR
jgi:hypothetical protein